jgi:hypothetical protein
MKLGTNLNFRPATEDDKNPKSAAALGIAERHNGIVKTIMRKAIPDYVLRQGKYPLGRYLAKYVSLAKNQLPVHQGLCAYSCAFGRACKLPLASDYILNGTAFDLEDSAVGGDAFGSRVLLQQLIRQAIIEIQAQKQVLRSLDKRGVAFPQVRFEPGDRVSIWSDAGGIPGFTERGVVDRVEPDGVVWYYTCGHYGSVYRGVTPPIDPNHPGEYRGLTWEELEQLIRDRRETAKKRIKSRAFVYVRFDSRPRDAARETAPPSPVPMMSTMQLQSNVLETLGKKTTGKEEVISGFGITISTGAWTSTLLGQRVGQIQMTWQTPALR